MNLKDIIELAKQGYKPSDIKELIALSNDNDSTEDKQEDKPEDKSEDKSEDKPEDKPEDKDRIIEELRKKLQNENLSGEDKIKTSTEILNNLVKDM